MISQGNWTKVKGMLDIQFSHEGIRAMQCNKGKSLVKELGWVQLSRQV